MLIQFAFPFEPRHDKTNKIAVRPAKTVWSESSLSTWSNLGSLATHWRLWLGGCPVWSESSLGTHAILLVFSWGGSFNGHQSLFFISKLNRMIWTLPKKRDLCAMNERGLKLRCKETKFSMIEKLLLYRWCFGQVLKVWEWAGERGGGVNRCGTDGKVDGIDGRGLCIMKYKSCLS